MPEERKGLIIVHTGPGKGKTTAALGTAFRAVGQGLKVLMVQFIKGSWHYGELDAAKMLGDERLKILPMGRGFVKVGAEKPDPEDVRMVEEAWQFARGEILSGRYEMVILDEINYAISYKMLAPEPVAEDLNEQTGNGACHFDRAKCSSPDPRDRRPGDGNARSQTSLSKGNPGAERN